MMIFCEVWLITLSSSGPRFILSEAVRACQGQMSNSYVGFFGNALIALHYVT